MAEDTPMTVYFTPEFKESLRRTFEDSPFNREWQENFAAGKPCPDCGARMYPTGSRGTPYRCLNCNKTFEEDRWLDR